MMDVDKFMEILMREYEIYFNKDKYNKRQLKEVMKAKFRELLERYNRTGRFE